ncbi:ABC transporter ATP-binding protein, partial [Streptacidiphilus carbonis]|uniref:ABC transporter ATP-binding protein n=1 Tax=Streptacidiphilus carbonis TaxID=105422 RepID=UPI00126A5882
LVVVVIPGGARIVHGHLTTAAFSAFLLYLLQLVTPVTIAATGIGRFQAGMAARARFDELFALEIESDAPNARTPDEQREAPAVEFAGVHFAYPGAPDVLNQLNFTAPATGLTAIVGPSGIGKSTTLSLIERFIAPDSGTISILGTDIASWPLAQLRSRITYVDQQFTLVEGSILENLQLGRTDPATLEELRTALRAVDMLTAIDALPDGMDTVLGREMDLSGGQRQRLALARALLTQADIVLLDEPTSQMDGINEKRFRDVVDKLARSRAVIVVAHRLTTVQHADHVVMFSTGNDTTAGTHDHLMEHSTGYRELVTSQAGH